MRGGDGYEEDGNQQQGGPGHTPVRTVHAPPDLACGRLAHCTRRAEAWAAGSASLPAREAGSYIQGPIYRPRRKAEDSSERRTPTSSSCQRSRTPKEIHHAPARVFVIDDDHSVRKALGRLLRAAGYEFELLDAAEAYLAGPPPQPPACLLLDIRMPGMTGLELQRAIEGTPMELPIVFITGHADEELLQTLSRRTVQRAVQAARRRRAAGRDRPGPGPVRRRLTAKENMAQIHRRPQRWTQAIASRPPTAAPHRAVRPDSARTRWLAEAPPSPRPAARAWRSPHRPAAGSPPGARDRRTWRRPARDRAASWPRAPASHRSSRAGPGRSRARRRAPCAAVRSPSVPACAQLRTSNSAASASSSTRLQIVVVFHQKHDHSSRPPGRRRQGLPPSSKIGPALARPVGSRRSLAKRFANGRRVERRPRPTSSSGRSGSTPARVCCGATRRWCR